MGSKSYEVLNEADVELSESTRIMIQLSAKIKRDPPELVLSLNKQWRDNTGDWQWGKGFQIPQEQAIEFLQKVCEVLGLDVQFAID